MFANHWFALGRTPGVIIAGPDGLGRGEITRQMPMNIIHDIVDAGQHLVIPVADDAITLPLQQRRSLRIIARLQRMLAAVDFNHQPGLRAQEVDDITMDRHLPPKTKALDLSCAQTAP